MQIISIDKLYDYNYSLNVVNALKQNWSKKKVFNCFSKPKKKNMLLYIHGCKAEYTLSDGTKEVAVSGDVIYTPINFEYRVRFFDFDEDSHYTIGINFFLYDEKNNPFILSDKIIIFRSCQKGCSSLFDKVDRYSESPIVRPSKMKAAMYDNLSYLSSISRKKIFKEEKFSVIAEGINYLEHDEAQLLSIREVAELCNVSEIYFRRLFKDYSGMSPVKFRIIGKIEKAKTLLKYENMRITETSNYLGFISPSYFSKQFKAITGKTPTEYKKAIE